MLNRQPALKLALQVTLLLCFLVGCRTTAPTPLSEASAPTPVPTPPLPSGGRSGGGEPLTATPSPTPILSTPAPIPPTDTPTPETAQPQPPPGNLSKIALASGSRIYTLDVDTHELSMLAEVDHAVLCCPTWSPDRQKVAFAIASGMYHAVYVVDADGSNLKSLTFVQRTDGDRPPLSPVWSEDGQHIDFVYCAYGYGGLDQATSPDGRRMAYVVTRVENDRLVYELYVKNADGTQVTKLPSPTRLAGIDW